VGVPPDHRGEGACPNGQVGEGTVAWALVAGADVEEGEADVLLDEVEDRDVGEGAPEQQRGLEVEQEAEPGAQQRGGDQALAVEDGGRRVEVGAVERGVDVGDVDEQDAGDPQEQAVVLGRLGVEEADREADERGEDAGQHEPPEVEGGAAQEGPRHGRAGRVSARRARGANLGRRGSAGGGTIVMTRENRRLRPAPLSTKQGANWSNRSSTSARSGRASCGGSTAT
jgi:hypothetical protein